MIYKLIISFFLASGVFVQNINCTQSSEAVSITSMAVLSNYDGGIKCMGEYVGLMDVKMKEGKEYKDRPATFMYKDDKLICDFPKIGKMPGKIKIVLPVKVNKDTLIIAEPEIEAGIMKMPMGFKFPLKLKNIKNARIVNNQLEFTMTVYGKFMGKEFPTTISFSGKLKR